VEPLTTNRTGVAGSPFPKTIRQEEAIMTFRKETVLFSALAMLLPVSSVSAFQAPGSAGTQSSQNQPVSGLVQVVRQVTAKYQDVSLAIRDGYLADTNGCVSSQDEGAMGVHYINGSLIGGAVDAFHPQGLVYEPVGNGKLRLVAVEYITIAQLWDGTHADGSSAKVMGQVFDYTEAPNRFRLPAVYTLHVWAWKYNPAGTFSMWNPNVSCTSYTE